MDIAAVLFWMLAGIAPSLLPVPTALRLALVFALALAFLVFRSSPSSETGPGSRYRMHHPVPGAWRYTAPAVVLLPAMLLGLYGLSQSATAPALERDPLVGGSIASAILLAPLVEEALFRGSIQQRMERQVGIHTGILLIAGIFAGLHLDAATLLPHFLAGVVFGYGSWTSGSIWPAVALHALTNVALATLASPAATYTRQAPLLSAAIGAASLGGLTVLYARASRSAPPPLAHTRLYHGAQDG